MTVQILQRRRADLLTVEAVVDANTRLVWNNRKSSFMLKFRCSGKWYYQWLCWECRGGRRGYFPALVALYRHVRRAGLVTESLRRLA